jgi:plastocyanin
VSRRAGPGVIAMMGMLGWFAAAYRPLNGTGALPGTPHRESPGGRPLPVLQRSLGPCPPSAGFKAGSVADHGVAPVRGSTVVLEASDSYFEPTCATGVPTGEVEVRVKNTGRLLHNISFEDPAIDQDVAPGETVTVTVKMGKDPRQFSCKYHRGAGMVGALLPAGTKTRSEE